MASDLNRARTHYIRLATFAAVWIAASSMVVSLNDFPAPQPELGATFDPEKSPIGDVNAPTVGEVFAPSMVIARVGDQHIFRGDIIGELLIAFAPTISKAPPQEREKLIKHLESREDYIRQLLDGAIQRKLMYVDFLRTVMHNIPKDKKKDVISNANKQIDEGFAKTLDEIRTKLAKTDPEEIGELMQQERQLTQLALLMQMNDANREGELDLILRNYSSSLTYQKQVFMERQMGNTARGKIFKPEPVITHEEMLKYYRENIADFTAPAKVRWEQLSSIFSKCKSRFDAGDVIADMGNRAFFGGSFIPVAKQFSQEPYADDGGQHDWVTKGSLKSKQIEQVLFTIDVGRMSEIIVDDDGLHIIRVIERTDAVVTPFTETQDTIRKQLRIKELTRRQNAYVEKLKSSIPVWTIYDKE